MNEYITIALVGLGAWGVVGCVVAALVSLGAAIYDAAKLRGQKQFGEGIDHERARIRDAALWFSEDELTRRVISGLANRDVSDVRDEWRRMRAAAEEQFRVALADTSAALRAAKERASDEHETCEGCGARGPCVRFVTSSDGHLCCACSKPDEAQAAPVTARVQCSRNAGCFAADGHAGDCDFIPF